MRMIIKSFPAEWRTSVEVIRTGGFDNKGNPMPETRVPIADCLVGWRSTNDPLDMKDLDDDHAVLYHDLDLEMLSSDRVQVPVGNWASGLWQVDGAPKRWAMGVEVVLARNV